VLCSLHKKSKKIKQKINKSTAYISGIVQKTNKGNDEKDKENKKVKTEIRTRSGTEQKSLQTHKTEIKNHYKPTKPTKQKLEITTNP
jgi:hypothetical protein